MGVTATCQPSELTRSMTALVDKYTYLMATGDAFGQDVLDQCIWPGHAAARLGGVGEMRGASIVVEGVHQVRPRADGVV